MPCWGDQIACQSPCTSALLTVGTPAGCPVAPLEDASGGVTSLDESLSFPSRSDDGDLGGSDVDSGDSLLSSRLLSSGDPLFSLLLSASSALTFVSSEGTAAGDGGDGEGEGDALALFDMELAGGGECE